MITKRRFGMEVKISEIDIGGILTLSSNWKGYSFNEESNSWIEDSDLYKDERGSLHPFCSIVSTNTITEIFKTCPINDNNILIVRENMNDIFMIAYILVGSIDIKNYKFKTKLLLH
jgi:hypothetical protein